MLLWVLLVFNFAILTNLIPLKLKEEVFTIFIYLLASVVCSSSWTIFNLSSALLHASLMWFTLPHPLQVFFHMMGTVLVGGWTCNICIYASVGINVGVVWFVDVRLLFLHAVCL